MQDDRKAGTTRPYSPVLGLVDEPHERAAPAVAPAVSDEPPPSLRLTVIVPARNEEESLPSCLRSLLSQNSSVFVLGEDWELLVIDDGSTDRTRLLAGDMLLSFGGARVLDAPPLDPKLLTGKSNACWYAAQMAQGRVLLFTDADTVHEPGSLQHALGELEKHNAALLSYSPKQIVRGFAQRTVMPLIFSELATVYKPAEVSDPASRVAAANGQFLMITREAYRAVGGHKALGRSVLEDVDLAHNVKRAKYVLRFRYAPDAVSTQMYRGFHDMVEGWTKNLAELFPHTISLTLWRLLDIALFLLPLLLWFLPWLAIWQRAAVLLLWLRTLLRFYRRAARAHFGTLNTAISPLGLPLFCSLLLRSYVRHRLFRRVTWKGRQYPIG